MTREQLLKICNKYKDNDVTDVVVLKEFINKIYDDFESRTCENCKHGVGYGGLYTECNRTLEIDMLNTFVGEDYGCNKFERL